MQSLLFKLGLGVAALLVVGLVIVISCYWVGYDLQELKLHLSIIERHSLEIVIGFLFVALGVTAIVLVILVIPRTRRRSSTGA